MILILKKFYGVILSFGLIFTFFSCKETTKLAKPNILLIMADDMGYSDIGCYGGEIQTPHLDQLAEQGIRFSQFYNTARCCPTRASLMTGLYPHESGVGHMTHRNNGGAYTGYLTDSCVTIAEVLKQEGYFTGMAGKWHAGAVRKSWPENRGFQRFYGIHHWVDSYFKVLADCEIFENGKIVIPASENPIRDAEPGKEWYSTDVFTSKAINHIDEAISNDQPFFEYVAYNSPHWPLEAHDDIIQKYIGKYGGGYEALRKEKYERMIGMGLISKQWSLPEQNTPEWNTLSDSAKMDTEFRRAIYAAQIEIMDENIGRLVDHLVEKNELDNTVIFFLSDNGCSAEPMNNFFGYNWEKNTKWNYETWRRNSARQGASVGRVWTITSNSPFRLYKRFTHEGGIATPLIVHWPDGIRNPGRLEATPGHLVDIMATCLDLAQTSYPSQKDGIPIKPFRGRSLEPFLLNEKGPEHEFIFWEHEKHGALRRGKYKIVSADLMDNQAWELYDMEADRTETNDLSSELPGLKKELLDQWTYLAYEMGVLPFPVVEESIGNPVDK
jgi:arylsulfatase